MKRKTILKKIKSKGMTAKSHTIGCKECGEPTVCASQADWVICHMCVAKMTVLSVRSKPKTTRKRKVTITKSLTETSKATAIVKKSLPKVKKKTKKA